MKTINKNNCYKPVYRYYLKVISKLKLSYLRSMSDDWKPVDSQVLVDAWEEIKDCAEAIQKDLACPDETISKMLRSVAETFDNTVDEILDKEEGEWED